MLPHKQPYGYRNKYPYQFFHHSLRGNLRDTSYPYFFSTFKILKSSFSNPFSFIIAFCFSFSNFFFTSYVLRLLRLPGQNGYEKSSPGLPPGCCSGSVVRRAGHDPVPSGDCPRTPPVCRGKPGMVHSFVTPPSASGCPPISTTYSVTHVAPRFPSPFAA